MGQGVGQEVGEGVVTRWVKEGVKGWVKGWAYYLLPRDMFMKLIRSEKLYIENK